VTPFSIKKKANVLGIAIDAVNMESTVDHISKLLEEKRKGYVCLVGVHGVMEAQRDASLATTYDRAAIMVPDGMPTVWVGHWQGHGNMERVTGPDLMIEVIRREEFRGYTHFLCGGKQGVAEDLRARLTALYPGIQIVGTYMPPFGGLSRKQEDAFITTVNRLQPDIIWVGISTPKQERFMARYLPMLDTTLMFGVGAAFDFHTGHISDCADWIKRCGLQWLDRLMQDPKHLWKRYLRNNPAFILRILAQLAGIKPYPTQAEIRSKLKSADPSLDTTGT
jgi:N-acetylglucosaminyldiphosphoundecaprenol N-acetyl-beta-D-mannosaminyltransferase